MTISTSPAGSLDRTDWFKGLRGSAITFVSGVAVDLLTEFLTAMKQCHESIDACTMGLDRYDLYLPLGIAAVGLAIEMIRRFNTDHQA